MLSIGKVLKAHGIRGDVKAESYMDAPVLFSKIKCLFIDGKDYTVERARVQGNFVLLKLKGVETMNDAEAFRNKELFARREDLPKPNKDRYYIDDVLGSRVTDGEQTLGVLEDILQHGSADVYVVKNGDREILFPLIDGVVTDIDIDNKVITVDISEFNKVAVHED